MKPVALLVLFAIGGLAMLPFLENSMIYFPTRYPEGDWAPHDLPVEDVWFESEAGIQLHGWYLPHEIPRAVVLFAHGNGGNLSDRASRLKKWWQEMGTSIMIFDYRGYGRSEGRPSEEGLYRDAQAAHSFLAKKAQVSPQEIVLLGRSLGGAVAVDLAAKEGARALILDCTFSSLSDVAAHHYPKLLTKLLRQRFYSIQKINQYRGPLLQSHGDQDSIVPYSLGQKLHHAANQPKQFITLRAVDHNDPNGAEYDQILARFLAALP